MVWRQRLGSRIGKPLECDVVCIVSLCREELMMHPLELTSETLVDLGCSQSERDVIIRYLDE